MCSDCQGKRTTKLDETLAGRNVSEQRQTISIRIKDASVLSAVRDDFDSCATPPAELWNALKVGFQFIYPNVDEVGIALAERLALLKSTANTGRRLESQIAGGVLLELPSKQFMVEAFSAREISRTQSNFADAVKTHASRS